MDNGDDCGTCPGNWDPVQDCASCKNHWLDNGDDCGTCPGNWDPQQDCSFCKGNWDFQQDCSVCKNHWVDDSDDCSTCPGNWDPVQDCASCKNHWVDNGDDCGTCPGNWDPFQDCIECKGNWDSTLDCSACKNHWVDNSDNCNTCPLNWDSAQDCATCRNHWVDNGDDCGTCPENFDPAQDCNTCFNHWDVGTNCTTCEIGWTGENCEKVTNCTDNPDFTLCELVTDPDFWYDICIDGVCQSPGACGDASCNSPGPHYVLADTNQRTCYDDIGQTICPGIPGVPSCGAIVYCGQDAQYGWDTLYAEPVRFSRSESVIGEPVVIDNVTDLMWQGCPAGLSDSNCNSGNLETRTWLGALLYCDSLNWGGHDNWHLPSRDELLSIVDYGRNSPAIDTSAFPGTSPTLFFWSSTRYAGNSIFVKFIEFDDGEVGNADKGSQLWAYCVRSEPDETVIGGERFTRTEPVVGEPIVHDNVTGLIWQGCSAGQNGIDCATGDIVDMDWSSALSYCENLGWGGYSSWRLPNIKELYSIVDEKFTNPAISLSSYPLTLPDSYYWSSSSNMILPTESWMLGFMAGGWVGRCVKIPEGSDGLFVRCLRGGL